MDVKDKLVEIVGADGLIHDSEKLADYAGDMSFVAPMTPDYVVKPSDAAMMEKLVKFARETGSIKETGRVLAPQAGMVGSTDAFPLMSYFIKSCSRVKQQLIDEGALFNDGTAPFIQSTEHGHLAHGEVLARASLRLTGEKLREMQRGINRGSNEISIEGHFGIPQHVWGDELHDLYGPHAMNYHQWLRKVKKTFDPNGASEASTYINAKD